LTHRGQTVPRPYSISSADGGSQSCEPILCRDLAIGFAQ
jgi:hypothetical protein